MDSTSILKNGNSVEMIRESAFRALDQITCRLMALKKEKPYLCIKGLRSLLDRVKFLPPDPTITVVDVKVVGMKLRVTIPGYRATFECVTTDPAVRALYRGCIEVKDLESLSVAESRAQEKLKELTTKEQLMQYSITSSFTEKSKRSGFLYLFRRGFPTLVYKETEDGVAFHIGLCVHAHGYEVNTGEGVLCPTDDVIMALLLMRNDERKFWAKANHHTLESEMIVV